MSLLGLARRALGSSLLLLALVLVPQPAHAQSQRFFGQGSLIIPMDIDYQDSGMLSAFGLVDTLLRNHVPVYWCISPNKVYGTTTDFDFQVDATDVQTNMPIFSHPYRGGPFVVDAADAQGALYFVHRWQTSHPAVAVHVASAGFPAPLWQVLTASPRIAVFASTNQSSVFNYLNAAGIPDESGQPWGGSSSGVVTEARIKAGQLTLPGYPVYSAILMPGPEVPTDSLALVEIDQFVHFPVLLFAENQAAFAIENSLDLLTPGFLTFPLSGSNPTVQYGGATYSPFFQMDAHPTTAFQVDPGFSSLAFDVQFPNPQEMLYVAGAVQPAQIWMAGLAKNRCILPELSSCSAGRIAYLGGYYTTTVPMSTHPRTQGARMFLDALLAGTSTIAVAQPNMVIDVQAPDTVMSPSLTVNVTLSNAGLGTAFNGNLQYPLPSGAQFVSATGNGSYNGSTVTWNATSLGPSGFIGGSVTMMLPTVGSYSSTANGSYGIGNTRGFTLQSNTVHTLYEVPVSVLISPVRTEAGADHIRLTWYAGGNPGLTATVSRRTESSAWAALTRVIADGSGFLRYEDDAVAPGVRYGYRLGVQDGGNEVYLGEVWAETAPMSFALDGVHPNPGNSGDLTVSFTLPIAAPARLELLDTSGRRVLEREVGALGAGSHTVRLADQTRIAPGVYLVRLAQGGAVRVARAVVLN